ncbi:MAG: glucose-1-phosphate adenylyltransferase [Planctomycetes bacterium]|nr:glucose-1-phosphate adenylyltransferase [Planctomycetota bacterium]
MFTQELKNTLTFVLAGGRGERLKPLTLDRAKPAVPFGGQYRIIDFTLSNCIHSGLRRIFVLTQYQANSLEEHIRFGWNFLPRRLEQFIVTRPPQHREERSWYLGTADAIFHNLDAVHGMRPEHVVVLSGDHIYRMDYGRMLDAHIRTGAALTIGAVRIKQDESDRFGILQVDEADRVTGFVEKPEHGPEIPGKPGYCLGSMGIYVFERYELVRRLEEDAALGDASGHDFGHDVIPRMIPEGQVYAHHFVDERHGDNLYWRDVGTIESYYEANIDLCSPSPQFNLYDDDWPTYTYTPNDPPAKTLFEENGRKSEVYDSLLAPGVIVSGGLVRRSVLSNRVFVDEGARVEESILFRGVRIGKGARVRRAIIDKWTEVPPGFQIGVDNDQDRRRFKVTDSGIVVVPHRYPFR